MLSLSDCGRIGYRTRGPVPVPVWVRALIDRRTAEECRRFSVDAAAVWPVRRTMDRAVWTVRRNVAADVYAVFPWPSLLAREFGTVARTVRWWVVRRSESEVAA
jgi:hypothetical protein